jgi:hypothetical protein
MRDPLLVRAQKFAPLIGPIFDWLLEQWRAAEARERGKKLMVTVYAPNGRFLMSVTNIGTFALQLSNNPAESPGYLDFPIAITNDDGSAPTISSDTPAVAVGTVTGTDPSYTGTVTAVSPGVANITISADGQADTAFQVVVSDLPLEIASVDPGTVVIVPPGAPAQQAAQAQALRAAKPATVKK